jgi:chaperonin GroEL (HSP60 family)
MQATLENDEQRVGADIIKRALPYALRLIANNSGQNGSVVVDKVRSQPHTAEHLARTLNLITRLQTA